MTTALLDRPTGIGVTPTSPVVARLTTTADAVLAHTADGLVIYGGRPGLTMGARIDEFRRRETNIVWIVLIVAIAIVVAVGIMAYVAIYCIRRGGNFAGGLGFRVNGWKVWEYRITFKCTR